MSLQETSLNPGSHHGVRSGSLLSFPKYQFLHILREVRVRPGLLAPRGYGEGQRRHGVKVLMTYSFNKYCIYWAPMDCPVLDGKTMREDIVSLPLEI